MARNRRFKENKEHEGKCQRKILNDPKESRWSRYTGELLKLINAHRYIWEDTVCVKQEKAPKKKEQSEGGRKKKNSVKKGEHSIDKAEIWTAYWEAKVKEMCPRIYNKNQQEMGSRKKFGPTPSWLSVPGTTHLLSPPPTLSGKPVSSGQAWLWVSYRSWFWIVDPPGKRGSNWSKCSQYVQRLTPLSSMPRN